MNDCFIALADKIKRLAIDSEREACAALAEDEPINLSFLSYAAQGELRARIAAKIRARGQIE